MNYYKLYEENELPLDNIPYDGGYTSIFRTIGFIGDSLSSGEHESLENGVRGYHDYYEYSWGQYIARKCGLKAYNFSIGGLRCDTFFNLAKDKNVFSEENKCQAYVIALGVNDMNGLSLYTDGFGTIADVDFNNEDNNKNSYVGWYCKIIQKLRKLEPKCRIFVVTTPKEDPETEYKMKYYGMIEEFLVDLPNHFEYVYTINLRKYAPIYNKEFKDIYFLSGHMNAMGYKLTGDMISAYIDYIIRHNIKDFTQVGFIGRENNVHNESEKW